MSYSIYNVSTENLVLSFSQNQKEPNRVGEQLGQMLFNAVKSGTPYFIIKEEISRVHAQLKKDNVRGIASVNLSCEEYRDKDYQDSNVM